MVPTNIPILILADRDHHIIPLAPLYAHWLNGFVSAVKVQVLLLSHFLCALSTSQPQYRLRHADKDFLCAASLNLSKAPESYFVHTFPAESENIRSRRILHALLQSPGYLIPAVIRIWDNLYALFHFIFFAVSRFSRYTSFSQGTISFTVRLFHSNGACFHHLALNRTKSWVSFA